MDSLPEQKLAVLAILTDLDLGFLERAAAARLEVSLLARVNIFMKIRPIRKECSKSSLY